MRQLSHYTSIYHKMNVTNLRNRYTTSKYLEAMQKGFIRI